MSCRNESKSLNTYMFRSRCSSQKYYFSIRTSWKKLSFRIKTFEMMASATKNNKSAKWCWYWAQLRSGDALRNKRARSLFGGALLPKLYGLAWATQAAGCTCRLAPCQASLPIRAPRRTNTQIVTWNSVIFGLSVLALALGIWELGNVG